MTLILIFTKNQFYYYLENDIKLSRNTIGTHFKNIKVFMKQSFERNLHKNQAFRLSDFKVVTEETDAPFLSPKELKVIYDLDLKAVPKH